MATKGEEGSSEAALGLEGSQTNSAQSPQEKSFEPANPEVKSQEPLGQNPKPNQGIDDDKPSSKEPPKSNSPGVDLLVGPEEAHLENSEQEEVIEHEALTHVDGGDPANVKSAEEKEIKSDKLSEETEHVSAQDKTPALPIPESLEQEKLAEDLDESLQATNRNAQETPSEKEEEEKGEIAQYSGPRGFSGPPQSNIPSADLTQVGTESTHTEADPHFQGETESVDPKMEKIEEEQQEEYSIVNELKDAAIAKNEGSEAENLIQQQEEVDYVDFEKDTGIEADEQQEARKLAREEEPSEDVASEKGNFNSDEVLMKDENKQDTHDSLPDEPPKEESTNSELQTDNSSQKSTEDRINVTVGENPEDLEDTPDDNPLASSVPEDATKEYPGNNFEDDISFTVSGSEAKREKTEAEGQGEQEERSNLGESAEETTNRFTEQQISGQDKLTHEKSENSVEEKRPDVTSRDEERNSDDLEEEASETVLVTNLVKEDAECWHSKDQTATDNIRILQITTEDATSEKETTRLHQETILAFVDDTPKLPIDKKVLKDGEDLSFSEKQEATILLKNDTPDESSRERDDDFQASPSKEKEEDEMMTQFPAKVTNTGDDTQVEATPRSLEDNCESLEKSCQEEEYISTLPNIEVKKEENEGNDCISQDGERTIPDDESSKLGKPEAIITYTDKDAENEPKKGANKDSEAVAQIEKECAQDMVSAENEGTIKQNLIEEPVDGHVENKICDAITTECTDHENLPEETSLKIDEEINPDKISSKYEEGKEEAYEQLQTSTPVKEETSDMNYDEQEKDPHATIPSVAQKFNESQKPSELDGKGVVFAEDIYAEVVQQSHEEESEDPATQIEKTSQPRSLVDDHQKPLDNDQTTEENLNMFNSHSQADQPNHQEEDRQATTPSFTKDLDESQNPGEQDGEGDVAPETAYAEVSPQSQEGDNEKHATQTDQEENRQETTALGTKDVNASQAASDRDGEDVVAAESAYAEVTSQCHGEDSQVPDAQMDGLCKPYKLDDNHQTPLASDQSSQETLDKTDVSSQTYQPKDQEEKEQATTSSMTRDANEADCAEGLLQNSESDNDDPNTQNDAPSQPHNLVDNHQKPLESDNNAKEILNTTNENSQAIKESEEPSERDSEDVMAVEAGYEEVPLQRREGESDAPTIQMELPSQPHALVDENSNKLEFSYSTEEISHKEDAQLRDIQPKQIDEIETLTTSSAQDIKESEEPNAQDNEDTTAVEADHEDVLPCSHEGDSEAPATVMELPSQPHAPIDDCSNKLELDYSAEEIIQTEDAHSQAVQLTDQKEEIEPVTTTSITRDIEESEEPSQRDDDDDFVVLEATYGKVPPQSFEGDNEAPATQTEIPDQPNTPIEDDSNKLELDHNNEEILYSKDVHSREFQPTEETKEIESITTSLAQDIREPEEQSERDGEDVLAVEVAYEEAPPQNHEGGSEGPAIQMELPSQPHAPVNEHSNKQELYYSAKEIFQAEDVHSQAFQPVEDIEIVTTSIDQNIKELEEPCEHEDDGMVFEALNKEVPPQSHEGDSGALTIQMELPRHPPAPIDDHSKKTDLDHSIDEILLAEDIPSQDFQSTDKREEVEEITTSLEEDNNESKGTSAHENEDVVVLEATYIEVPPQTLEENNEAPTTQTEIRAQPHTQVDYHSNKLELDHSTEELLQAEDVDSREFQPTDQREEIEAITTSFPQDIKEDEEPRERDSEDVTAVEAAYEELPPQSQEADSEAPAIQIESPSQPHPMVNDHTKKLELDSNTKTFQPIDQKEEIEPVTTLTAQDIKDSEGPCEHDDEDVVVPEAVNTELSPQRHEEDTEAPAIQKELPTQPPAPADYHSQIIEQGNITEEILHVEDVHSRDFQPTYQKEEIESITTSRIQEIKESEEPSERDSEEGMAVNTAYEEVPLQSHDGDSEAPATQMELSSQPPVPIDENPNKMDLESTTNEILHAEDIPLQDFQCTEKRKNVEELTTSHKEDIKEPEGLSERDNEDAVVLKATYIEVAPTTQMEIPAQPHTLELDHNIEEIQQAEDVDSLELKPTDQKEKIEAITTSFAQDIKEHEEPTERDSENVMAVEASYEELPPQSHEADSETPAIQMESPSQPHPMVTDHSNKLELDSSPETVQPIDRTEEIEKVTTLTAQDIKDSEGPCEHDDEDVVVLEAVNTELSPRSHEEDTEAPTIQIVQTQPAAPLNNHSQILEQDDITEETLQVEDVHSHDFQPTDQKEKINSTTTSRAQDIKESEEPSERDSEDAIAVNAAYEEVPPQSHDGDSEAPTTLMELSSQPPTPADDNPKKIDFDSSIDEILNAEDIPLQDFQSTDNREEVEEITTSLEEDINESKGPSERNNEDVVVLEATYIEVPPKTLEENNEAPTTQTDIPEQPHTQVDYHSNKLELDHSTEELLQAEDVDSREFQPTDQREEIEAITTSFPQDIKEDEEPRERDSEDVTAVEAAYEELPPQSQETNSEAPAILIESPSQPHPIVIDHSNKLELDSSTKTFQPKDQKEETEPVTTLTAQDIKDSEGPCEHDDEDDVVLEAVNTELSPRSDKEDTEAPAIQIELPTQPPAPVDYHSKILEQGNITEEILHVEDVHSRDFQPTDQKEEIESITTSCIQDIKESKEPSERDSENGGMAVNVAYEEVPPLSRDGDCETPAIQMELSSQPPTPIDDDPNKKNLENKTDEILHAGGIALQDFQSTDKREQVEELTTSLEEDIKESDGPSERGNEDVVVLEATYIEVAPQTLEENNKAPATQMEISAQPQNLVDYHSNKLELDHSTEEILQAEDVDSREFRPTDHKEEIEAITTSFAQDIMQSEEPSERVREDAMAVEAAYEEVPSNSPEGDREAPVIEMELPRQLQAPVNDYRMEKLMHTEDIQPIDQKAELEAVTTLVTQDIKKHEEHSEPNDEDGVGHEATYTGVPPQSLEGDNEEPASQTETLHQPHTLVDDHSNKLELDHNTEEIPYVEDVHSQDFRPTNQKEEIEVIKISFAQDITESEEPSERDSKDAVVEAAYEEVSSHSHEEDSEAPAIQMESPGQPQNLVDDRSNKLEIDYSAEEILHVENVHSQTSQPIDQIEEIEAVTNSITQDIKEPEGPSERDIEDGVVLESTYTEVPPQSQEGDNDAPATQMEIPAQPRTLIDDDSKKLEPCHVIEEFQPTEEKEEIEPITTSLAQDIRESEEPSERDGEEVLAVEAAYEQVPLQSHEGDSVAPTIQMELPNQLHTPVDDHSKEQEVNYHNEEILHTEDFHSRDFQPGDQKEEIKAMTTSFAQDIKESQEPSERDSEDVMAVEVDYEEMPPHSHDGDSEAPVIQVTLPSQPQAPVNDMSDLENTTEDILHKEDVHSQAFQPIDQKEKREVITSITQNVKETGEPSERDSEDVMAVEAVYEQVAPQCHEGDSEAPTIQLEASSQLQAPEEISRAEDAHSQAFQLASHKEEREAETTSVTQYIKESEEPREQGSEDAMLIEAAYVEVAPLSHEGDNEAPATKIEVASQSHPPVDVHENKLESDYSADETLHAEAYHSRAFQPIDQTEQREAITTLAAQDIRESKEPSEIDGEDCVAPGAANVEVSPQSYEENNEDPATQNEEPTQPHILLIDQQITLESDQSTQQSLKTEYVHSQAIHSVDQKEEQEAITHLVKQDIKEFQEPSEQDGEDTVTPETAYLELTSQSREGNSEDSPIQMEVASQPHTLDDDHKNPLESDPVDQERLNTEDVNSEAFQPKELEETHQAMIHLATEGINELQHPNKQDGEGIAAAPQRHTRVNEDPAAQMEAPSQPHTLLDDNQNPLELEHGYQENLNIGTVNSQASQIKDQEEHQQAKLPSTTQDIMESEGENEQDGEGTMAPELVDPEVTPQGHNGDFEGPATDPREGMSIDKSTSMALTDKAKGEKTEQDIPGQYEAQMTVPSEEAAEEDKDEDGGYGSPEKSTSAQIDNESDKTAVISMNENSELEKLNEKTTLTAVDQEYSNATEDVDHDSNIGQLTGEIAPSQINKDESLDTTALEQKFTDQEELTEELSEYSIEEKGQHIMATEHEKNSTEDLKEEADEPLETNLIKEEAEHQHSREQPREQDKTNVTEALAGDATPELENVLLSEDKDIILSLQNDMAEKREPETEGSQMSVDNKCLKNDPDGDSEPPQDIDDGKTQDKETIDCNEDSVLLEGKFTSVASQDKTLEENEAKKQEPNEGQKTVLSEESLDQRKQPKETTLEHIDDQEERRDVIIAETEKYSTDELKEEGDPLDGHKSVKEETDHLQSDQPRGDHVNNIPASEDQTATSETKASDVNKAEIYPQSVVPSENQEAQIHLESLLMEDNDGIQEEAEHQDLDARNHVTLDRDLLGQTLIEDHFFEESLITADENSQASLPSEQDENRLATMQLSDTQETDKYPTSNNILQPPEETYVEVDKQNIEQDGEDLANKVDAPHSRESTMSTVDTDKREDTNQNRNSSVVPTVEPMKEESEAREQEKYGVEHIVPNEEGVHLGETVEEATTTYTDKGKGEDRPPTEEEVEEERAKDAVISKNKDLTFDNFSNEMARESTLMKEDTDIPEENKGDVTQNLSISEQEESTEAREKSVEEKKQDAFSVQQADSDLEKEAKEAINSSEGKENSGEHEGSEEITTVQTEKEDVKDTTFTENKEFNLVDDTINPSAQKETTHGPAIKEENGSAMPTNLIEESMKGCLENQQTDDLIVTQEESNPMILTEEMAQSQINKDESKEIIFTKQESLEEEKLPGEASTAHSDEEKIQVDNVPGQEKIRTDGLKEKADEPLEVNKLIEEEAEQEIPTGQPTPDHDDKILETNEKKDGIISLVEKTLNEDATQSAESKVVPRIDGPDSAITLEPEEVKDEGTIKSEAEKAYMQPQENQGNEIDESPVIMVSIENQEVQSCIISEATARNVPLAENLEGKGNESDVTIMKKVEESDFHMQDLEATSQTSAIQTEMAEDNGLQSIKENQNDNGDEQAVEKGRTQVEGENREVKPTAEDSGEIQEIDESQVDNNKQMGMVHLPVSQLLVDLILKEEGEKQYGFEEDTKGGFEGAEKLEQQENSGPSQDKEGEMEEPKSQDLIPAIGEDTLILEDQENEVVFPGQDTLINIAKNDGLISEISNEIPKDEKKKETEEKGETEEVNNRDFVSSTLEIKELTSFGDEASTILEEQGSDKQKTESISDGGKPSRADKVLPSSDNADIVLPSSETLLDIARNEGVVLEISHEVPQDEKKNATEEKSETEGEVKDKEFEFEKVKSDVITTSEIPTQVHEEDSLILEDQDSDKQITESNIGGGKTSKTDVLLPGPGILIDIAQEEGLVLEKKIETEESGETGHEIKDKDTINYVPESKGSSDASLLSKTTNNDTLQEKEVQKSDTISENHPKIEIQNKALTRNLLSETIETETSQSQGKEKSLEPKSPVTEVNKVEGEESELKLEGKERAPVDDIKDRRTDEICFGERATEEIEETEPTERDFHKQEITMEGKYHPMSLEKSNKDATQHGSEEEKSDDGEERDEEEHKEDKSAMDVSAKAETIEGDLKSPHKKSHNILSGVTSKVKHSIAKVKKAITGKPSHPKSPVPKEHT